jgi:tetratricopeptide (TPR) repeat protein
MNPEATDGTGELGRVRIARGEYGDAIEIADGIVRRGEDVFAHGLGPVFILAGLNSQLRAMYDPEMEHSSSAATNVLTHLHAGINDVWTGRFSKAVEHFERGTEFLPGPWSASRRALFFVVLARIHLIQGRVVEANEALHVARGDCGDLPILDYVAGVTAIRAGSAAEVQSALARLGVERRSSAIGWSEPWRLLLAGEIELAAGHLSSALGSFRDAWRLQRPLALDCVAGHIEAYYLDALGRAYLEARRPREALRTYEQIRSLGLAGLHQPAIGVLAFYRLGRAHEALGNRPAARERYEEFLKLWGDADVEIPEVGDARRRLDRIGG